MTLFAPFRSARTFNAALDILAAKAVGLGFDAVDYAYLPRARTCDGRWMAPDIASRNFPAHWNLGWQRYASQDPYLWRVYERNLPLDWDDVKGARWLSETQRDAIAFIDGLGFLDGITVPIHLPGGGFAFVSGLARLRHGAWRADADTAAERLFVLAHAFHAAAGRHVGIVGREKPAVLSPREKEVLYHAAAGLSAPATARALNRSVETVRRQRKSAMRKLNAATIAQAAARAVSLDLFEAPYPFPRE